MVSRGLRALRCGLSLQRKGCLERPLSRGRACAGSFPADNVGGGSVFPRGLMSFPMEGPRQWFHQTRVALALVSVSAGQQARPAPSVSAARSRRRRRAPRAARPCAGPAAAGASVHRVRGSAWGTAAGATCTADLQRAKALPGSYGLGVSSALGGSGRPRRGPAGGESPGDAGGKPTAGARSAQTQKGTRQLTGR